MPRTIDPVLLQALERANPNVCHMVEVNALDVAQVLRRAADQFLSAPYLVSQTPANALVADPAGALTIASNPAGETIASFTNQSGTTVQTGRAFPIPATAANGVDIARAFCWQVDTAFTSGVLKSLTAIVQRKNTNVRNNLLLQIYRRREAVPGSILSAFEPLLASPIRWTYDDTAWTGGGGTIASVTFDFSGIHLEVGHTNVPPIGSPGSGEEQAYYFVILAENATDDDLITWILDQTTSPTVAHVGTFSWRTWQHYVGTIDGGWILVLPGTNGVPCATLALEAREATAQAVYLLDLGRAPTAGSSGRVVFERSAPAGTAVTCELSTAGSGGPWTAVKDGDAIAIAQQTYDARVTLTASADARLAPAVHAIGVEFITPVDVTAEAIVEPIAQQVDVPFLDAGIGEGQVTVLRTGRRDHRDPGADLAAQNAVSQLEVDVRLGSRHPLVTRDRWLLIDRALVNNRAASPTAELFGLLSYLKILKQKIPPVTESINTVHTVTSADTGSVTVTPALPKVDNSNAAHAYANLGYYVRVRSSAQVGVGSGFVQTITDNSGPNTLTFSPALPGTFVAGDVVEVHSATFVQNGLSWSDADPADVWWEILTVHCGVPAERIGRADLGRAGLSGLPPKVADRAPNDAATQAKLTVTLKLTAAEEAAGLINQLSFILGGATVEIGGQIVFRQIYPLRDATGQIVVAPEPIAETFDVRNTIGLDTPVALEQRITSLACDYGVNTTAVSKDTPAAQTTIFADVDAIAWLDTQPVDELAPASIPTEIARWCYNSADLGLYLAGMLTQQVVRAASTGLRVWTWSATDAKPQLVVGDRVVVVTDQYTDYDPARQLPIRGWWAFPLVVVSVAGGGRQFRGYMLGLTDAVQVKGGAGTLAADNGTSQTEVLSVTWNDANGVRTYTAICGAAVARLFVHHRLWPVDGAGDKFDFTQQQSTTDAPELDIVAPDPADGKFRFSLTMPLRGFEVPWLAVPRQGPPSLAWGDDVWKDVLDAAPAAINAKLHPARSGAIASLSIDIAFGLSDGDSTGVQVDVIEDSLTTSTTILSRKVIAPGTIDSTTDPALGNRALPGGKDFLAWRVRITDVSGQAWWFGPANASRDPLADATATLLNYRSNPAALIAFGPDTDSIEVIEYDGRTKTWDAAALALAGSPVTYESGVTALDDSSTASALAVDETRSGFTIRAQGGGTWTTILGPTDLHGQPKNPPTALIDTVPNSLGTAEDVYVTPNTATTEKLHVYFRDGDTDAALQWRACVGAADPTPLAVVAGTRLGPATYFARVDGFGSPTTILAAIATAEDQLSRRGVMIEGAESGIQSPWLPVVITLQAKPWNQSVSAEYLPASGKLRVVVMPGARALFEAVQIADNKDFTSPTTQTAVATPGTQCVFDFALSLAQRGKPWYARATPNNLSSGLGLDGDAQPLVVQVGPVVDLQALASEPSVTTGRVTLTATDNASVLDPTFNDSGAIGAVSWHVTKDGVTTIETSTTTPGAGTSGAYTKDVALDPLHTITVQGFAHLLDGSTEPVGTFPFDSNKISDLYSSSQAVHGANEDETLQWDTDTLVGANCARYSLDGGTTWTTVTVTSGLLAQFSVARLATTQTMLVQAKNAIDGNWGNQSTLKVSAYLSEGPIFSVQLLANTPDATHDRIVWSCAAGTALVSIDGGTFSTPGASPIDVAKPATGRHTYVFQFTNGGVTVTDEVDVLPVSADTITPNLDVALGTPTATTVPVTVSASNPVSGGTAPTITAKCVGCTMAIGGTTYPDGTTQTITSGTVVTGNRAATTTASMGQLELVATLGTATEKIVVPVPPQTQFGPIYSVQKQSNTPDNAHDTINWSCSLGTALVNINNAGYGTPAASPIVVAKPATIAIPYVFKFTNGGITVTDEVDVLPVSADTVTPNLDVALGTPTATTMPYTGTATNPLSGGSTPSITVKCVGCTMTISGTTYPDGTTQTISSGTVVTGNKPSSSSTTSGNLEFVATLGTATEKIVVPVPPQSPIGGVGSVQVLRNTPDSSHDRFTWSATRGTMMVSIDGASYGTPSASPWDVSNTSTHTYDFKLTADDGSTQSWHFDVGTSTPAGGTANLNGIFSGLTNAIHAYGNPGTVDFTWTASGFGVGVNVEVWVRDVGAYGDQKYHLAATGVSVTAGTYTYTAGESLSNTISPFVTIGFSLRAYSGSAYGTVSEAVETNYGSP